MPIDSIASIVPTDRVADYRQAAVEKLKAEPRPKQPFDPAPALRPTIQDKIDVDRALLKLRHR